jgi:hypothetical protein
MWRALSPRRATSFIRFGGNGAFPSTPMYTRGFRFRNEEQSKHQPNHLSLQEHHHHQGQDCNHRQPGIELNVC